MAALPLVVLHFGAPLPKASRPAAQADAGHGGFVFIVGTAPHAPAHDAVLHHLATAADIRRLLLDPALPRAATDCAVVVLAPTATPADALELIGLGVQELVTRPQQLARSLQHAIERKRVERAARNAYATDLATGLPHQAQLLEHMTHLLALRQRSPMAMALLVLRVQLAPRLDGEVAALLRRKVAVRLRGALRAGDVVAALGADTFGALLGHLEAAAHAERVAAKLVLALQQPFKVSGQPHGVTVSIGLATVPEHGSDAASLLRRASAQAEQVSFGGGADVGHAVLRGPGAAANDENLGDGDTLY